MFRNTGSSLLRAPYDKDMDNTKINQEDDQAAESIQQTNQPAARILPLLPTPTNARTQCHEATASKDHLSMQKMRYAKYARWDSQKIQYAKTYER